jgi:chromosome partitioning protein
MRIISAINPKGGVGKSTLVACLAVAAVQAGERVMIVDTDDQGSCADWARSRCLPDPTVAFMPSSFKGTLADILADAEAQAYSMVFIDTAGSDSPPTHSAMMASDLCLVPLRPSRTDAVATKPIAEALIRTGKPFLFVLSQCPATSGVRAVEMAAGLSAIATVADPFITSRVAWQDSFASGKGITEYEPQGRSADELRRLYDSISGKG